MILFSVSTVLVFYESMEISIFNKINDQVTFQKTQAILVVDKTVVLKRDSVDKKLNLEFDYFVSKTNSGKIQKFNTVKYHT